MIKYYKRIFRNSDCRYYKVVKGKLYAYKLNGYLDFGWFMSSYVRLEDLKACAGRDVPNMSIKPIRYYRRTNAYGYSFLYKTMDKKLYKYSDRLKRWILSNFIDLKAMRRGTRDNTIETISEEEVFIKLL